MIIGINTKSHLASMRTDAMLTAGSAFYFMGTFTRKKDAKACEEHWRKKGKRARRHLKGKEWAVFHD